MSKIVDYLKQYIGVISIVLALCILLTYSLSYFKVNGGSKRAAEMYIGELKYTISIDGASTNTLTVSTGETIVDVDLTNLNEIKTYYKLLYLNNSNISISYFNQTKNTSDEITSYKSPSDAVESKSQNSLKLRIMNNSTINQTLTFKVSGGYSTNTLVDVEVPNTYTEITALEVPSTNTYFCKTNDTLSIGLEYVDGPFTYSYKKEGKQSYTLSWDYSSSGGWGVQLTNRTSTDPLDAKVCTYINNKPIASTSYMFYTSKATTIDMSNFNTKNVTNMSYMFNDSYATSINVSGFNTSNVTKMRSMFDGSDTVILDVSNFDTSKVTDMSSMFASCNATTLDVSNFNTSKVTDMSYMFNNSKAVTLDLSNFDTRNVTDMWGMFWSSYAETLDLKSFNTYRVTSMATMFSNSKASTIDLSSFDTRNVTTMKYMFQNSQAKTLDLSNFNTSKVTDMNSMFVGSQATSINLSNFDTSKVTTMSSMFKNSKALTLDLSSFDTSGVTDMGSMFADNQTTILNLSSFNTSNVKTMSGMFYGSQATSINLSSFNTSKVISMSNMFRDSKVATLDLSGFDTSNVVNMRDMFYASNVTILDVSSFDTSNVTEMGGMFESISKLKTIYASNKFVTTNVTDNYSIFNYSYNLVGGSGTKYDNTKVDKTYARIDGGTSNPGYFTDVADKNIPEPNSFSSDSWKTIIKAVKNNNTSKYNVGDTKSVDMGTSLGTHTLRIANKSTPSSCNSNSFSQSACGFVLEFVDIVTDNQMNEVSDSFGGWPSSKGMVYVNNIYNALPEDLKSGIIDTYTISGHPLGDRASIEATDKLYLLAPGEIYKDWSDTNDSSYSKTRQLDYYSNNNVTTSSYSLARKKTGSTYTEWWLRSATFEDDSSFYIVYNNGSPGTEYAIEVLGLSPAFRIG